jgi:hypothetical protein
VFIVAKTAMIGLDALKKTSRNTQLLHIEEVKQIPLPESTEVEESHEMCLARVSLQITATLITASV